MSKTKKSEKKIKTQKPSLWFSENTLNLYVYDGKTIQYYDMFQKLWFKSAYYQSVTDFKKYDFVSYL